MEQQGLRDWMRKIEADLERMDDKWQRSVDDIKATIKSEVADLKSEQIADLKARIGTLDQRVDGQNVMLSDLRTNQERYDTARGVVNWLIKTVIGIGGVLAGAFGWEHIRH